MFVYLNKIDKIIKVKSETEKLMS